MSAQRFYGGSGRPVRWRRSQKTSARGIPTAAAVANAYPAGATPGAGLAVGFGVSEVTLRRLLAKLAKMGKEARQKMERKAINQALWPMKRAMRKQWRDLAVGTPSSKRIRHWTSKAVKSHVDRFYVPSRISAKAGRRERYGKVYISYAYKYKSARLAHMLENPDRSYRTAGPIDDSKSIVPRKFGKFPRSYRVNHRVFQRYKGDARRAFITAVQGYMRGWETKDIKREIKRVYG